MRYLRVTIRSQITSINVQFIGRYFVFIKNPDVNESAGQQIGNSTDTISYIIVYGIYYFYFFRPNSPIWIIVLLKNYIHV